MATFEKRGSSWRAKVRRAGLPPIVRTFDTKTEAQRWATNIEAQADTGILQDQLSADAVTLHDALARYARDVTPSKKGARQEASRIKRWQRHELAGLPLGQIRASHLASWRDTRLKAGTSPTTIRTDLALISHLYTTARKEWSIPVTNPCADVRLPAPARGRDRRLEGDEEKRLLEACRPYPDENGKSVTQTPWLAPAVELAIATAMRLGELVSLKWQDVDWQARTAFLRDTKNGDVRRVPLSKAAIVTLLAIPLTTDPRVLPTSEAAISQAWGHAVKRAKISGLRFHDLRHEATARLFERSDLRDIEIASITGHKTHAMLKRYANLRAADLAARLD